MFQRWLFCAVPWLAAVAVVSIYGHYRSLGRFIDAVMSLGSLQAWLHALTHRTVEAILFYGVLPASVTLLLFVLFLPWADGWARAGSLEE